MCKFRRWPTSCQVGAAFAGSCSQLPRTDVSIGADQFTAKDKHAGCRCDARNFPRIVFPIQDAASGLYTEQTVMDSDSE